jgi:baculoviral IAP repeat-containing protein 7/8
MIKHAARIARGLYRIEQILIHASLFPTCPFILDPPDYAMSSGSYNTHQSSSLDQFSLVSKHEPPKHLNLVSSDTPTNTFKGWPPNDKVKVEDLVDAGFFYIGILDYVKCFFCDVGVCNWELGDKPWTEHCRWSKSCRFVKINKGHQFIDECQRKHKELLELQKTDESSRTSLLPDHLNTELLNIMKSEEVSFYLSKDIPLDVLRMIIKRYMIEKQRGFASRQEFQRVLSSTLCLGRSSIEVKKEPSTKERGNILCKICMDNEMGIVFLPCGHLVGCPSCSISLNHCPLCRKPILRTVRSFPS